jgi:DNA polymerase-1
VRIPYLLEEMAKLAKLLDEELAQQEMSRLYQEVELPLTFVLAQMERTGISLDEAILAEMGHEFDSWINQLTGEIYRLAGEEINLNSPKQLGVLLFDKLGLAKGKKTKTGYSTSAEVLEALAPEHEIVAKILDYRQLVKLKSTYIDGLRALREPRMGRVYTTFNQAITATGRLSSTEPNLQNIPIRMEEGRRIRRAFLPSDGKMLLSADYSQIELRVLAHLAGDAGLIEAFRANQDIHTRTAAEVFGVSMESVTPQMRRAAKAVNFGIIYGISDFGLSRDIGISRAEAKEYIANYFARYPQVKAYLDRTVEQARAKGYVTTILNRRRYLPDIHSRNYHLRSFAERAAMNSPIQGSAADIMKLAMLKVENALQEQAFDAFLLLQVHDELILEVAQKQVKEVGRLVKKMMCEAYALQVPLKVDLQMGANWYDLQPLDL